MFTIHNIEIYVNGKQVGITELEMYQSMHFKENRFSFETFAEVKIGQGVEVAVTKPEDDVRMVIFSGKIDTITSKSDIESGRIISSVYCS